LNFASWSDPGAVPLRVLTRIYLDATDLGPNLADRLHTRQTALTAHILTFGKVIDMSSINSVSSGYSSMMQGMHGMRRPDTKQMAEDLFSKLDASGQGQLSKVDLQTAFDNGSNLSGTSSVDEFFSQLDGNGDGAVTKTEFTDTISKLADQMASAAMQGGKNRPRMEMPDGMSGMGSSSMGGMRPMRPEGDGGLTEDELSSLIDQIDSAKGAASGGLSDLLANSAKADADGDSKVSAGEAMTYRQSQSSNSSTSTNTTSESKASSMSRMIFQLMHAYNIVPGGQGTSQTLAVTA